MGVIGFGMQTVGDPLNGDAMPAAQPCDLSALAPQMTAFCNALGDDIRLSIRRVYTTENFEQRLTYLRSKNSRDLMGVLRCEYGLHGHTFCGSVLHAWKYSKKWSAAFL